MQRKTGSLLQVFLQVLPELARHLCCHFARRTLAKSNSFPRFDGSCAWLSCVIQVHEAIVILIVSRNKLLSNERASKQAGGREIARQRPVESSRHYLYHHAPRVNNSTIRQLLQSRRTHRHICITTTNNLATFLRRSDARGEVR